MRLMFQKFHTVIQLNPLHRQTRIRRRAIQSESEAMRLWHRRNRCSTIKVSLSITRLKLRLTHCHFLRVARFHAAHSF